MSINRVCPEIDRGLMYAEACFETFRVVYSEVFGWQAHMDRLARGLDAFGVGLPHGLKKRCLHVAGDAGPDVLMRLTVTGGVAARGLAPPEKPQPGVYIQAASYQPRHLPVHLRSTNWPFPLRRKVAKYTSDYAETLRALHILKAKGFACGDEVLVCDENEVYSGVTSNVLIYRHDRWWTPDSARVMPGVIRASLVGPGLVTESGCPYAWLKDCTAMALTNSGGFIRPVSSIDGRELVSGGAVFDELWRPLTGQPGVVGMDSCN